MGVVLGVLCGSNVCGLPGAVFGVSYLSLLYSGFGCETGKGKRKGKNAND